MLGGFDHRPNLAFQTVLADVQPQLVVERLQQQRDAEYDGRVDFLHIAGNVAHALGKRDRAAAPELRQEADGAFVDMVQREDRQADILSPQYSICRAS